MDTPEQYVITGALGYTGKYITRLLLSREKKVKTLTDHPNRHNPFGDRVPVAPLNFNNPGELVRSLQGNNKLLYETISYSCVLHVYRQGDAALSMFSRTYVKRIITAKLSY